MSPLARRTPQDQWRGPRAYSPNEAREFLMGRGPRIHGELLKPGFVVSQATVSRYMPRRGYPPTQRWRTFLRNQAFAIGFGEAGRRVAQRCCVPGSSAVHPSKRHPLDLASRRLSPYRSRASPRRKLAGIRELDTIIRYRAQSQADHNSFTAIALCVCHEQSETLQKFAPKKQRSSKACRHLAIPLRFGYRGRGYEKR
jgi:hypothetical protein